MISKIFSLRNYVMKQLMKTNKQGIMQIPDKGKVDFGEMLIKEQLFKKGIDSKAITSERQLDNILNTPTVSPHSTPKKPGEVINVDFDKGRWKDIDPEKKAYGGIAGLGERTPMKKGNRALTNIQNEFLKLQLKNNPEFIAEYFPNIITEGPRGPLYDVDYQRDRPANVSYKGGAEFRDVNVPYDTKGSRINIKATPRERMSTQVLEPFPRPNPDYTTYAYMKPHELFYKGEPVHGGQTQAINMAPWILESYGTAASSPRNEMVPTPEWWHRAGEHFDFETGDTVDQATLNDFITSVLAHETSHGIGDLPLYAKGTEKASAFDFSQFLTPNQKQSKELREAHDVSKMDKGEKRGYAHAQEELFNRMKDIERLKRMFPDSYEDHPLWDLYQTRARQQFSYLTGQDWKEKGSVGKFELYEKKIKPSVDKYFERVEKKGKGMSDINIGKEEIRMPENLTRVEAPYVSRARPHEAQGGQIGLAYGGKASSGLNYLLGEDDQNMRVPFKDGSKFDPKRRTVLKGIAALATLPVIGKFFKWAKPLAKTAKVADLTSVPIKAGVDGMPVWFKPLVNKVIREGEDVTAKMSTKEREIVHQVSLEGKMSKDALGVEDIRVTQDLDEGIIRVQYNSPDSIGESGVELVYKKGEEIPIKKKGKDTSVKTKDEFTAVEDDFYPETTSPDGDFDLEFTENIVKNVDDLYSDTSKLKEFATGKKLTIKEISESMKKKNILKEIDKNPNEHAFRNAPEYDGPYEDFASGGRVPFAKGKKVLEGLEALMKKFFPGTTKLGKTSRPMAEKTQLKQAIAKFQEREKAAKLKIWENPDKVRAAVDDIFSTGDYKYDAEMAAEALVENNPKAFGGKLYDDIDDATRMEIYGAVLKVVQSDLGKMLQLKRASRPTKTLEGIEKTGTINISDDAVAEEFARFMKETDPKGHKKIEEIVEITNFDPKGKKGHASGGLAGMLGE